MAATHRLKTIQPFYEDVVHERKRFEIRKNDRGFAVGDLLVLDEWDADEKGYTGSFVVRRITYMVQGVYGLPDDVCVLGIEPAASDVFIEPAEPLLPPPPPRYYEAVNPNAPGTRGLETKINRIVHDLFGGELAKPDPGRTSATPGGKP